MTKTHANVQSRQSVRRRKTEETQLRRFFLVRNRITQGATELISRFPTQLFIFLFYLRASTWPDADLVLGYKTEDKGAGKKAQTLKTHLHTLIHQIPLESSKRGFGLSN